MHGFFVGRPLDCVFVDRTGAVLAVARLDPWGIVRGPAGTWGVVELEAGEAGRMGIRVGSRIGLLRCRQLCQSGCGLPVREKHGR